MYIIDVSEKQVRNPLTEMAKKLELDNTSTHVYFPRDPAAGNRVADEAGNLCIGRCFSDFRPVTKKEESWLGFESWVNAGRVRLVRGAWNEGFKDQLRIAPRGAHDDKIDAATAAFEYLRARGSGEVHIGYR